MTTMAQHLNLVEAAVEGASEVAFVLDHVEQPYHTLWFHLAQDYFVSGDTDMRLAVIDRLPDAISNRRNAGANMNSSANIMALLDRMLAADDPEITAVARHTGLVTVRCALSDTEDRSDDETLVGPEGLPMQPWFYRVNRQRAALVVDRLLNHQNQATREAAHWSNDYWLVELEAAKTKRRIDYSAIYTK